MNQVSVIAYYADDRTRLYQLVQWLPVLELLHQRHPVGIVARDPESATLLRAATSLPVFAAPSFPELTDLYAELDGKVVLYCNNSMLNFQSLIDGRMLHVHINHGESDKHSMASNNAKAYDRVFVAGEAAVQRHTAGLLEFDTSRLVRTGRPQLDLHPARALPPARGGRSSTRRPGRATRSTTTTRHSTPSGPTSSAPYSPCRTHGSSTNRTPRRSPARPRPCERGTTASWRSSTRPSGAIRTPVTR